MTNPPPNWMPWPAGITRGQAQAQIDAAAGGDQLPYLSLPAAPSATGVAWPAANTAEFIRFRVGKALAITQMAYGVGTAAGNVDLGIYAGDGTTWTRLASTGSTPAAGSGTQTIALSAPLTLQPGTDYWLAMAADSTALAAMRQSFASPMGLFGFQYFAKAAAFPLPATVTVPAGTTYTPWIGAQ